MKYIKLFEEFNGVPEEYLRLLNDLAQDLYNLNLNLKNKIVIGYGDWSLNFTVLGNSMKSLIEDLQKSKYIDYIEEPESEMNFNFLPPYDNLKDEIFILFEAYQYEPNEIEVTIRIDN